MALLTRGSNDNPVEQTEDGRGKQTDQRPDHPLENVNPGILGFDFGPDLGDLGLNLRKFDIDPGALGVDLGSNGGDDVLPGLAAAS